MASKTKTKSETAKAKDETMPGNGGTAAARVDAGLQLKTLAGDVRDLLLEWLRHRPPGAFRDWPAALQRETAQAAQQVAEDLARAAMRAAAGAGFASIPATLKSFAVKDGTRVVLEAAASNEVVMALNNARGAEVVLVPVRAAEFLGERAPVEIAPDQAALFAADEDGVVAEA